MSTIANLQEFKAQMDIVDIIGSYIELEKKGSNYFAKCPFHDENTPSFSVNKDKQIYHCFGCNASGDSINFVMEYKKLDFMQSCKEIASLINFSLDFAGNEYIEYIDLCKEVNTEFLNYCLSKREHILDYMQKRGFDLNTIKTFNIGYAGENFEIRDNIKNKKLALELGILKDNPNGYTSNFANRLIIPIFSSNNNAIGFVGRTLGNDSIKYINSKDSKIYKKGNILFNYNLAKGYITKAKECYLVEGYLDAMSLYQVGIRNVVAICGSALSEEQISLITKLDSKIILAFDKDSAGLNATARAIKLLIRLEIYDSYVAVFKSNYKDCNDLLLHDKDKLLNCEKMPIIEYYIRTFIYNEFKDCNSLEKKSLVLRQIKNFLDSIKDKYLKTEYDKFANRLFGIEFNKYDKSLCDWKEELKGRKIIQYESGISFLDDNLYNGIAKGFELGQLVLISGEPDSGKTSLILQILENLSKHSKTYFFSLEFSIYKYVIKRNALFNKLILQGKLRQDELNHIEKNMYIIDDIQNLKEVESKIASLAINGIKFFAIDSQMCLDVNNLNGEEAESEKFKVLYELARKYNILIFLITQTSKADNTSPFGTKKGSYFSSLIIRIEHNKIKVDTKNKIDFRDNELIDQNTRTIVFQKNKQGSNNKVVVDFDKETQTFSQRDIYNGNIGIKAQTIRTMNIDDIDISKIDNSDIQAIGSMF